MNLRKLASVQVLLFFFVGQAGAQSVRLSGVARPVAGTWPQSAGSDGSGSAPEPTAVSPESNPTAKMQAVAIQLAEALASSSLVPYYGSLVRSAYLQQAASTLLALPAAQQISTGAGIVAVIDTGVDPYHPALAGSLVSGYDFTRNQATTPDELQDLDPTSFATISASSLVPEATKTQPLQIQGSTIVILDGVTVSVLNGESLPAAFGHGTMTAGLIHLVAPTASIMPLKAFQADGTGKVSDIVNAIYFAVSHGAQVINMSFDVQTQPASLQTAIAYATSQGVICIAAAGNEGQTEVTYPSGFPNVIGVGSTNDSGQLSSFSNYGTASVFMTAPGEALITPYPGGNYAGAWGTSFSAALVSGTVASMLQINPQLTYPSVTAALSNGSVFSPQQPGQSNLNVFGSLEAFLSPE